MNFQQGHIYHVYNQGNNRQNIFFNDENYLFFQKKMRDYLLPYADILAWCLMPNHFHWMLYVHHINVIDKNTTIEKTEIARSLNDSIGILLRSYTRAINKQQGFSGSLFRNETKASCMTHFNGVSDSYFNTAFGAQINFRPQEKQYPKVCFDYIHQNPVRAHLVSNPADWKHSSYQEIYHNSEDHLVNIDRIKELGLYSRLHFE